MTHKADETSHHHQRCRWKACRESIKERPRLQIAWHSASIFKEYASNQITPQQRLRESQSTISSLKSHVAVHLVLAQQILNASIWFIKFVFFATVLKTKRLRIKITGRIVNPLRSDLIKLLAAERQSDREICAGYGKPYDLWADIARQSKGVRPREHPLVSDGPPSGWWEQFLAKRESKHNWDILFFKSCCVSYSQPCSSHFFNTCCFWGMQPRSSYFLNTCCFWGTAAYRVPSQYYCVVL